MLGGGEGAVADVACERAHGGGHLAAKVRVALDEARLELLEDSEEVVEDEHLAVGARAGTDADSRYLEPIGNRGGDLRGHSLEHQREAARCLERQRVVEQLPRCGGT